MVTSSLSWPPSSTDTNQTVDQVNKVFSLNLKTFSPPKIDGEYIGSRPENPLFTVDSRHQQLADTIGRICNGIPERPIGSNWLVNITEYQPPNGTDWQVLGPAYRIQLTSNKLLLFLFELGLVDPNKETNRLHDGEIESCQNLTLEAFLRGKHKINDRIDQTKEIVTGTLKVPMGLI